MKKFGSLVLVLVMVLSSVSALAALPEGYVYEPWRGDKGGVISAEISRLNDRGVTDSAAIQALPPQWQTTPNDAGIMGRTAFQWYNLFLEGEWLFGEFADAFELLDAYGISDNAAVRRVLRELDMDWDEFMEYLDAATRGDWHVNSSIHLNIAAVNAVLDAVYEAIPAGTWRDPIRAANNTTLTSANLHKYYWIGGERLYSYRYIDGADSVIALAPVYTSVPGTQAEDRIAVTTRNASGVWATTIYYWDTTDSEYKVL